MVARRGHFWQWYRSRHETVRLHWAEGRGADESIGSTEPMRMEIAVCADCGLILATRSVHEGDGTYRHVQGYGFDLERSGRAAWESLARLLEAGRREQPKPADKEKS